MNGYSVRIHMYFEYMNGYNFLVFSNFSGTTIFNFISHLTINWQFGLLKIECDSLIIKTQTDGRVY
jgi:hypothetical protein